jgi:hypothetical protein
MTTPTVPPDLAWLAALREARLALAWTLPQWDRVVRVARGERLLGRLAEALSAAGLLDAVPEGPRRHLESARRLSADRLGALRWALERVDAATAGLGAPRVLLKGAAYVGQELPIAPGRLPSDLDILVPRAALAPALARLHAAGWTPVALDAHDQRYYAEWSHEAPPMRHALHAMELDVHHDIVAPVARDAIDIGLLLARLRPARIEGWMVLDPVDQVLHSAAHLFLDSAFTGRLRDLVDLDGLLRHFAAEPDFLGRLAPRAREVGLIGPLVLAVHFCRAWLATPVPVAVVAALPPVSRGLAACFAAVLRPGEPGRPEPVSARLAALALLARHHRRRMPMRLLVPHLWHKLRAREPASAADA